MASRPEQTTQTRERVRRAVSESDKQERRAAILAAAEAHFSDVGFERFSMEVLAKQLGMARGTSIATSAPGKSCCWLCTGTSSSGS